MPNPVTDSKKSPETSWAPISMKWKRLYFILAAFNLLAILALLAPNYLDFKKFNDLLDLNLQSQRTFKALDQVTLIAIQANAPANDVFESKDVSGEKARFMALMATLEQSISELAETLQLQGDPQKQLLMNDLTAALTESQKASLNVLELYRAGRLSEAGPEMAMMDRSWHNFHNHVGNLRNHLNEQQQVQLKAHQQGLQVSRSLEISILFIVLGSLIGFSIYGDRLSRFLQSRSELDSRRLRELEKLTDQLETAQKLTQTGSWEYDPQTNEIFWSKQVYTIFGVDPKVPPGQILKIYQERIHPEDAPRLIAAWEKALKEGTGYSIEHRIVLSDGGIRIVSCIGEYTPAVEGMHQGRLLGTAQDVTHLRETEDRLKKREAFIHSIYSQSHEAMMTLAPPEWKFTSANPAAIRLFGFQSETEFCQAGPWSVSPKHQSDGELSGEKARKMIERALRHGSYFFKWQHLRRDGVEIPCTVILSKVQVGDEVFLQAIVRDISHEIAKENELRELMNAIEQSAIVSTTDIKGKILTVNDEFCRVSGYRREELVGRDHRIVNSGLESKKFFEDMWKTILSEKTWSGEMRNRTKNGSIYTVKSVIAPVRNYRGEVDRFISIRFDLTEQRRLQQQLEEAQKVAKIGNWSLDLQTRKIEWSKQMFDLFHQRIEDGPPTYEKHRATIHPEDLSRWEKAIEQCIQNGKPYTIRFRTVTENKVVWIEALGHGISAPDGRMIAMAGTCQDITEKIETEQMMEQQRLKTLHSSKLASLGEMSAGVAHEINNPLAIIKGTVGLLQKFRDDPEKFTAKVDVIDKAVTRISKIVTGLRKFSRSSDQAEAAPHVLANIIQEAMVIVEPRSKRNSVPVEVRTDSQARILCDSLEIEQALINLINNGIDAVKDKPEGWVRVHLFEAGQNLVVQIHDSGQGLPSEVEARLFQPFFTTKPVGEGTGLGLSICKGILDHHKATLNLNKNFSNTCFEIRFRKLEETSNAV